MVLPGGRLRLAFFGTPEIARIILERLLDASADEVVRVYCQPDRPKGRGKRVQSPPVKALAESRGLPISQPVRLKDGVVAQELKTERIDLAVVVAYGRILPPALFEAPRAGTWNVHASLLPAYRGAAPIQHAILRGESRTGVTLMQLTEGLDEGPMLLKRSLDIMPDDTGGRLTERLAILGADALLEGLRLAKTSGLGAEPQDPKAASWAPLLRKEDGFLDISRPASELARQIRAFDPWPGTFLRTTRGPLKILAGRAVPSDADAAPGLVLARNPFQLQTGQGAVELEMLQVPGRTPVSGMDYLRGAGRDIAIGERLIEAET